MPGKKPAVLVVDDDPSIPRLIENQLDCVDVELLINDGVTPVMDTIGALRPAVALVDWHLGRGGDSGEIVVMLNADYPECVQMIVSADAGIECQSRAMSAGAWLYVNKTQIALEIDANDTSRSGRGPSHEAR